MRIKDTLCGVAGLWCMAVFALPPDASAAPADCALLENAQDRLVCFDKQFPRSTPASTGPAGNWQTSSRTSEFTDLTSHVISASSQESAACRWNRGEPVHLKVQCLNNATSLVLETNCYMTSSRYRSYGEVLYRIDNEEPKVVRMEASPDNRSLGLWGGENSIPLIREMVGKSKFTARLTPYAEKPFTATFDITGLDEALKDVRAECSW
jgi:type VI secretion system protein VasI